MSVEDSEATEQDNNEPNSVQTPNFPRGVVLISEKFYGYPTITEDVMYGHGIFNPQYDTHDRLRLETGKYWVQAGGPNETPSFYAPFAIPASKMGSFYRKWYRDSVTKDITYEFALGGDVTTEPTSIGVSYDAPEAITSLPEPPSYRQVARFRLPLSANKASGYNISKIYQDWQGLFLGASWEGYDSKPLVELGYPYEDFQIIADLPFSKMEIDASDSINESTTSAVAIDSNYNYRYFFDDYLLATSHAELAESFLPSLYHVLAMDGEGFSPMWLDPNEDRKLAKLIDKAVFKIVDNITDPAMRGNDNYKAFFAVTEAVLAFLDDTTEPMLAMGQYARLIAAVSAFRRVGIWFDKLVSRGLIKTYNDHPGEYQQIKNKFKNIAFTDSARHLLKETTLANQSNFAHANSAFEGSLDGDLSGLKLPFSDLYPMSVNIDLSATSGQNYDLYNALKFTSGELVAYALPGIALDYGSAVTWAQQKVMERKAVPPSATQAGESAIDNYSSQQSFVQTHSDTSNVKETVARNVWDLTSMLHGVEAKSSQAFNLHNADYCTFYTTQEVDFNDPANDLVTSHTAMMLRQKLFAFFTNNFSSIDSGGQGWFRSYEDILKGKASRSELLFWRIEKSTANEEGVIEPVQHIYVPNSPDLDIAHYVDTQVKYAKHYYYKIFAYYGVGATRYIYQDIYFGAIGVPEAMLTTPTPPEVIEVEECFDTEGGPIPCSEMDQGGEGIFQNTADMNDAAGTTEGLQVLKSTLQTGWSSEWSQSFWNKFAELYEQNLNLFWEDAVTFAGHLGGLSALKNFMIPPTYSQTAQVLNMPVYGIEQQSSSWIRQFFGITDSDPMQGAAMVAVVEHGLSYGSGFGDMWNWLNAADGQTLSMGDINSVADNEWSSTMQGIGDWTYTLRFFTKMKIDMISYVISVFGEGLSGGADIGFGDLGTLPGQHEILDEIGDSETSKAFNPEEGWTSITDGSNTFATLEARVVVNMSPRLKLVEIPYLNTSPTWPSLVLDRPPNPPSVNIIPYSGNPRNVLILFDETSGNYLLTPKIITKQDEELFKRHSVAQGVKNGDPIQFGNDNATTEYQVFRTTMPPSSFESFSMASVREAQGSSLLETLEPNRKYYYMFRSIDRRGNVSNPSSVYEVELVTLEDGSGSPKRAVLPIIRPYSFPDPILTNTKKEFRKYLMIEPASHQAAVDSIEQSGVKFGIPLREGEDLKSVFSEKHSPEGRRFKLRITSKKTGRKMDLNFQFKQKHELV